MRSWITSARRRSSVSSRYPGIARVARSRSLVSLQQRDVDTLQGGGPPAKSIRHHRAPSRTRYLFAGARGRTRARSLSSPRGAQGVSGGRIPWPKPYMYPPRPPHFQCLFHIFACAGKRVPGARACRGSLELRCRKSKAPPGRDSSPSRSPPHRPRVADHFQEVATVVDETHVWCPSHFQASQRSRAR